MTIVATTTDIEDVQEMVDTGNEQIASVQSQIDTIDERIQAAQAQLTTLEQDRQSRTPALHEGRATVERLEQAHTQAVSYAKLAHKTPQEPQSIKDVSTAKKALDAARKELTRIGRETTEASQAASEQEQGLQKEIHRLAFEKSVHEDEIRAMATGLQKAQAHLGTLLHASLLQEYQDKQSKVDALLEQLVTAQVALHDFHESASRQLEQWDNLHKDIARLKVPDDAISQTLTAALHYIEVMQRQAPHTSELPSELKIQGLSLWDAILFHPSEITDAVRHPQTLTPHKERIQKTLDAYLEQLAK